MRRGSCLLSPFRPFRRSIWESSYQRQDKKQQLIVKRVKQRRSQVLGALFVTAATNGGRYNMLREMSSIAIEKGLKNPSPRRENFYSCNNNNNNKEKQGGVDGKQPGTGSRTDQKSLQDVTLHTWCQVRSSTASQRAASLAASTIMPSARGRGRCGGVAIVAIPAPVPFDPMADP